MALNKKTLEREVRKMSTEEIADWIKMDNEFVRTGPRQCRQEAEIRLPIMTAELERRQPSE